MKPKICNINNYKFYSKKIKDSNNSPKPKKNKNMSLTCHPVIEG